MTIKQAQAAIDPRPNRNDYAPAFNTALLDGLFIQAVLFILTRLMMSPGPFRAFLVALLCQLAIDFMILIRRPMVPTKLDLAIVRYGIIPLFVIFFWFLWFGPVLLRILGIPNG